MTVELVSKDDVRKERTNAKTQVTLRFPVTEIFRNSFDVQRNCMMRTKTKKNQLRDGSLITLEVMEGTLLPSAGHWERLGLPW
jgi:hypothetical protein